MEQAETPTTPQRHDPQTVKAAFEATCGPWPELYDPLLDADPAAVDAWRKLIELPARSELLEPKLRELIGVAICASTAHLYEPGLRMHARNALSLGASESELLEVIEIASVLGIHSCTMAMPLLVELTDGEERERELTERELEVRKTFQEDRGFWSDFFEDILRHDAEFVEAYRRFSTLPLRRGHLSPKEREFIYIAINVNATHLYEEGIQLHIRSALRAGASEAEILDVIRCVVRVGLHAGTMALPLLAELTEA